MRLIDADELIKTLETYKFGAIQNEVEREYIKETVLNFVKDTPTACDPDIIAEYIKERHPALLQGADFALYQISYTARKFADAFLDTIKGVDWGKLAEYAKEQEEGTK